QTSFADKYRKEVVMAYLDSLNMIYVALTRSEEVFWAIGEAHASKGEGILNKLSFNIQLAIQSATGANDLMSLTDFYNGEKNVLEIGEWPQDTEKQERLPTGPELSWTYRNWSQLIRVKKYSE